MTAIWRLALVSIGAWLAWQILVIGISDHLVGPQSADAARDVDSALAWNPGNETALLEWARKHIGDRKVEADAVLAGVVVRNPANPQPLLTLADSAREPASADALMETASRLAPTTPEILTRAATYWLRRGELPRAIKGYSQAMIADPAQTERMNPLLLKLLEDPAMRGLLLPLAQDPPVWWDPFFRYVAKTAADVETVRGLFAMRKSSSVSLTPVEREVYVERLRRDGRYTEAYLTWVNGLDEDQRQWLGLLNNGSFEVEPTSRGYDWRLREGPRVVIETAETYGTEGKRALHLAFRGFDARFGHVSQDLFLEPGQYRLVGRVRPDGLKSSGGLKWQVQCEAPTGSTPVAEGAPFLGMDQWDDFSLDFSVPAGCERPVLRLVGAIRTTADQRLEGSIWFDGLRIERVGTSPAAGPVLGSGAKFGVTPFVIQAADRSGLAG